MKNTPYPNLSQFSKRVLTNRRENLTIKQEEALKISKEYQAMLEEIDALNRKVIELYNQRNEEIQVEFKSDGF